MRVRHLAGLALTSIERNAGRSLLTMLGVVIGVGSVVVMIAIGRGAQAQIDARIASLGSNLIVVTPGAQAQGGVSGGAGSFNRLKVEDAEHIATQAQAVAAVTPVIMTRTLAVANGANWRTAVHGVDPSWQDIRAWPMESGRFFTPEDLRGRRKVCVIGATTARNLFPDIDPVGQTVRLRDVPMEVVGLLAAKGPTVDGTDQDDIVLAPSATVQTRLAGRQFIGQLLVSAWSEADVAEAMGEVKVLLRESHGLAPHEADDFEIRDQAQIAETARGTTEVMTMLLSAVASVSLLVGGIGIMNIMLVSVTERTREIGIRRALGARRRDVLAQFLVEAVVLSGIGGLVGAALGVGATVAIGRFTGWATQVTGDTLALALAFSMAVGVFFGWYPARRAAALDVIEALRHA